jgi:excinuclease ABC subunit A
MLQISAAAYGIDLNTAFEKFPEKTQDFLLNGEPGRGGKTGFHGIFGYLKQNLEESTSEGYRDWLMDHMSATECPACHGKRLRPESLAVKVNGMSIGEFTAMPVERALKVAEGIKLAGREAAIAGRVMHEVVERLQFLNAVGLGYISLDRSAAHSAGDADWIEAARRALCVGRALDRTTPSRQWPVVDCAGKLARPGQHGAGGGAR